MRLGLGGNVDVGAAGRADPATSIGVAWQTDDDTVSSEISGAPIPIRPSGPRRTAPNGVTWVTPAGSPARKPTSACTRSILCGLTPATTYYYRVGGGPAGSEVWSEVYSFTTTPKAGPGKVTIGVLRRLARRRRTTRGAPSSGG